MGFLVNLGKLIKLLSFGLFKEVLAILLHLLRHGKRLVEVVNMLTEVGTSGVFRHIGLESKLGSLAVGTGLLLLRLLSFRLLDDRRSIIILLLVLNWSGNLSGGVWDLRLLLHFILLDFELALGGMIGEQFCIGVVRHLMLNHGRVVVKLLGCLVIPRLRLLALCLLILL